MTLKMVAIVGSMLIGMSCSGVHSGSRSTNVEKTTGEDGKAKDESRPNVDSNVSRAADVVPISGINLAELKMFVSCVVDSLHDCRKVRLGANVKVASATPIRFAADTVGPLGIKSSRWTFRNLPSGVTCSSEIGGDIYNPSCYGSETLASQRIDATLTLVGANGASALGQSPNDVPSQDKTIYGNFMKLSPSSGLAPIGPAEFSEVWQDLSTGMYLSNILYDGSGNINWTALDDTCRNKLNSGDSPGKWRLPTMVELCGPDFLLGNCYGGLTGRGLRFAPFAGGNWADYYFWSSTVVVVAPGTYWLGGMSDFLRSNQTPNYTAAGAFCVR